MRWLEGSVRNNCPRTVPVEGILARQRRWLLVVGLVTVLLVSSLLAASSRADTVGTLFINTNTTLTENHNGDIIIGVDGVTLDCAGYTVTGPGDGLGIFLDNRTGVTVKNCDVTNFSEGIAISGQGGNTLTGNIARLNSYAGISLGGSDGNTLDGNQANDNGFGAHATFGFLLVGSSNNVLTNNSASDNGETNFGLEVDSNDNMLSDNTASGGSRGFAPVESTGNTFHANTATGAGNGFVMQDADNNVFSNNWASDGGTGFNVGGSGNTFTHNHSSGNFTDGFNVGFGLSGNTFRDNTAHNNGNFGFVDNTSGGVGDVGTDNFYVGNLCIGNTTGRSSPNGLCLGHGETVNLVEPNGRWHLRRPNGSMHSFFYGNPGDVGLFGDWDGDGFDTPGMYRPTNGFAYLTNDLPPDGGVGFGDPALTFFFGGPGDQVFVGDWDGDGIDTLGISRNGKMFLANTNATVVADLEFWFGTPTDIAFGGDPDGDGQDSVFLYRPSSGFTYFTNSTPVGPNDVAPTDGTLFFGVPTDRFVIGDWNGSGTDTVGVFRPNDTTVYLRNANTTGPAHDSYVFGQAQWLPTAGIWS